MMTPRNKIEFNSKEINIELDCVKIDFFRPNLTRVYPSETGMVVFGQHCTELRKKEVTIVIWDSKGDIKYASLIDFKLYIDPISHIPELQLCHHKLIEMPRIESSKIDNGYPTCTRVEWEDPGPRTKTSTGEEVDSSTEDEKEGDMKQTLFIGGAKLNYVEHKHIDRENTNFYFRGDEKDKCLEVMNSLKGILGMYIMIFNESIGQRLDSVALRMSCRDFGHLQSLELSIKHAGWRLIDGSTAPHQIIPKIIPSGPESRWTPDYDKGTTKSENNGYPTVEWEDPYPRVREAWIDNVPENELPKTFTARFRFPDGKEAEIPAPGKGWEIFNEDKYGWPCIHIEAVLMEDHEGAWLEFGNNWPPIFVTHEQGLCWLNDFGPILEEQQARILWTKKWEQRKPITIDVEPDPTIQITSKAKAQVASTWPKSGKPRKVI